MKNIEKVIAIMVVETNSYEQIVNLKKLGESGDGLVVGFPSEREIEFITEEDFEEPSRENFENFIKDVTEGKHDKDDVAFTFLTSIELS